MGCRLKIYSFPTCLRNTCLLSVNIRINFKNFIHTSNKKQRWETLLLLLRNSITILWIACREPTSQIQMTFARCLVMTWKSVSASMLTARFGSGMTNTSIINHTRAYNVKRVLESVTTKVRGLQISAACNNLDPKLTLKYHIPEQYQKPYRLLWCCSSAIGDTCGLSPQRYR